MSTIHDRRTHETTGRVMDRRRVLGSAVALSAAGLSGCLRRESVEGSASSALVTPRRAHERGHADHGWLDTYHTFSFAGYRDPAFTRFGPLRVLNQDRVVGGGGFPMHGHRDMEIVSLVLEGALEHRDTMGNGSVVRPGEVQLMSAGAGVQHSEFNASPSERVHFLQMWVLPSALGTRPRYEQRSFSAEERRGRLRLVVSPGGDDGSLRIDQDARLFTGLAVPGEVVHHALVPGRGAWLHVATGSLEANGVRLGPGDGAAVTDGERLELRGLAAGAFVLWDVPLT